MNRLEKVLERGVLESSYSDFKLETTVTKEINTPALRQANIPSFKPGENVIATLEKSGSRDVVRIVSPDDSNKRALVMLEFASDKLRGFTKEPSTSTMEKWMEDGVAKSITGKRVEPDGTGPDGSPSWLLVLGMI